MNSDYNNLVQMISNKNNVTYSNVSKKSESLEMGSMSIVGNIYDKKFLFKIAGTNPISVDMNSGGIDFGENGMIRGISDEVGEDSNIAASQKLVHSLSTYQPGNNIIFDTSVIPNRISVNDVMSGLSSINGINFPSLTSNFELSYPSFLISKADGVSEIGRILDFHLLSTPGVDNNYRMFCTANGVMNFSGSLVVTSGITISNGLLNGILITSGANNIPGNRFAYISGALVLEGGRFFDWHYSTSSGDYTARSQIDSSGNLIHDKNVTATNLKSNNETRLVAVENGVIDLNIRMNGVESNIDLLGGRMDTAESDIVVLRTDLSTTVGRVGTCELDIDSLNDRMNNAESDIVNLENEDVLLDGRVTNCETDITDLDARIGTCESNISNLGGRVTTCESGISGLDGRVTTLENEGPDNHNDLLNIQGGDSGERYHLNENKYNQVVDFDFVAAGGDLANINTKIQNIESSTLGVSTTFDGNVISDNLKSDNESRLSSCESKTQNMSASVGNTVFTGTVNGCNIKSDGSTAPARPYFAIVKNDGLIEGGRYFDWNYSDNSGTDRTSRTEIDVNGNISHDKFITANGLNVSSGVKSSIGSNLIDALSDLMSGDNYVQNSFKLALWNQIYPIGSYISTSGAVPLFGSPFLWTNLGYTTTNSGTRIHHYRRDM